MENNDIKGFRGSTRDNSNPPPPAKSNMLNKTKNNILPRNRKLPKEDESINNTKDSVFISGLGDDISVIMQSQIEEETPIQSSSIAYRSFDNKPTINIQNQKKLKKGQFDNQGLRAST